MATAEQVQDEISRLLRQLACPVTAGESVKACIRRAALKTGLTFNQTKRLWYSEWREVPAHVADNIRTAAHIHDRKLKQSMVEALSVMQSVDPEYFADLIQEVGAALLQGRNEADTSGPEG